MKIEKGSFVMIMERKMGGWEPTWEVVVDEVDQYGDFCTVDSDGQGQTRNVEDIDQVR